MLLVRHAALPRLPRHCPRALWKTRPHRARSPPVLPTQPRLVHFPRSPARQAGKISYEDAKELHWFAVFYRTGSVIFGGGQVRRGRCSAKGVLEAARNRWGAFRRRWRARAHGGAPSGLRAPSREASRAPWACPGCRPDRRPAALPGLLLCCRWCCQCCTTMWWTAPAPWTATGRRCELQAGCPGGGWGWRLCGRRHTASAGSWMVTNSFSPFPFVIPFFPC